MKNILKNIVLCLLGIVLMTTLTTTVAAAPAMYITSNAAINEDADVLEVNFKIYNDNQTTALTDDYTVIASTPIGETRILTTDTVTLETFTETTPAYTERTYSVNLPIDENNIVAGNTYSVNVDVTGATSGLTQNVDVSVYVTGVHTEMAPWIIEDIEFDDETTPEGTVDIEVTLEVAEDEIYEDVTIEAWIEDADGEERLTEREETSEFNIGKSNDDDKKIRIVSLEIPEDADEGDYYVAVRVKGENDGRKGLLAYDDSNEITVERNDHNAKILYFQYDEEVEAGDTANFAVGLLNNGREDETVRVRVSISGLDVSQTSGNIEIQVDEYAPAYFAIAIPEDADEDDYTVKVNVYNDDIDFTRAYTLSVEDAGIVPISKLVLGADATVKQIASEGGVYLVTLTNNGANTRTFTMDVTGASIWADYSVNPATVTVAPGTSQVVSVFVNPNDDATGTQTFTVNVKEGATVVNSIGLTAQVSGGVGIITAEDITTGLQWLVAILIVVAIVLGIAWAIRREK